MHVRGRTVTHNLKCAWKLVSYTIDIIYYITWIGNAIIQNGHIYFMDMTQDSHSNAIYGSVNEFVKVHKSLLDSP